MKFASLPGSNETNKFVYYSWKDTLKNTLFFAATSAQSCFVSANRKTNKQENLPRTNETLKHHSKISHKGAPCRTSCFFFFFCPYRSTVQLIVKIRHLYFLLNSWLCNPLDIISKSSYGSQRTQICIQTVVSHFKVDTSNLVSLSCKYFVIWVWNCMYTIQTAQPEKCT